MSQMEMFPEVVATEKTILELRAYWSDWDRNKKLYPLPKKEDDIASKIRKEELLKKRQLKSELLAEWRGQMKSFTYA